MQYDTLNILLFFIIYGFSGFILETVFRSITEKKFFIGGGFLTNGFCPLYGISALAIIQIFTLNEINVNNRLLALIIATIESAVMVTFLEYVSGRILDRVFHHKMWDYSDFPINLHSYICLDFSLMWGIVSIILANIMHPIVEITVYEMSYEMKLATVYTLFPIIFINAFYSIRKLHPINTIKL